MGRQFWLVGGDDVIDGGEARAGCRLSIVKKKGPGTAVHC